jgi:ABC-type transporter MlaC component
MANVWTNLLLAVCLTAATQSFAQEAAPDALLKGITADVTEAIQQDKDLQAGNTAKLNTLVEARIVPHFDFERATREAMGFNWRQATPEQRRMLTAEFGKLLVRTYSETLASYRGSGHRIQALAHGTRRHRGDRALGNPAIGNAGHRGGIRPGEDRFGLEDLRYPGRWHEPRRDL